MATEATDDLASQQWVVTGGPHGRVPGLEVPVFLRARAGEIPISSRIHAPTVPAAVHPN